MPRILLASLVLLCIGVNSFQPVTSGINFRSASLKLRSSSSDNVAIDWQKKAQNFAKGSLLAFFAAAQLANARPEGVNRPDLLPKELNVPLIDVANFLTKGQEKKVLASIGDLQKTSGWKLRVLCQRCLFLNASVSGHSRATSLVFFATYKSFFICFVSK